MEQGADIATRRWPAWVAATGLLVASFAVLTAMSLHVRADAEAVAVAYPPWWSSQQVFSAVASAHADIIRITGIVSIVVVKPDGAAGLARLRASGVWLTIDPQVISACLARLPGNLL
jgi:hypothetical protein